jgi:hypothetical protein
MKISQKEIVLVEIAFEAAIPLGVRSGDGEPGEEFGERARRRRPVDLAQGVNQILRCHVAPIHSSHGFCYETLGRQP